MGSGMRWDDKDMNMATTVCRTVKQMNEGSDEKANDKVFEALKITRKTDWLDVCIP